MTLHVQLISLDRPGAEQEDAAAFAARLDRVAGVLRKSAGPKFDLLGITSAFAPVSGLFPLPEEKKIPAGGGSLYAVEALAKMLSDRTGEIFHFLSSEQGILGRSGRVEVIGEWAYRNIGPYLPGALRRCAVSGRLKLAESEAILPFFSVRISPKTSNAALRQAQVMGLIAMAKETWTQGDLTPLVVGDFGFDRDSKTLWEMMSTDFDEVTVVHGQGSAARAPFGARAGRCRSRRCRGSRSSTTAAPASRATRGSPSRPRSGRGGASAASTRRPAPARAAAPRSSRRSGRCTSPGALARRAVRSACRARRTASPGRSRSPWTGTRTSRLRSARSGAR